ncbi:adenylate/guanylate cyclase domain-containing protein [bacterium]|nr:adenylate/guanylate cyclase domain-containing protein [bacterium]MBU1993255.1 adenylate/guanylate cyclase domain-containing protein [bacterium]
MKNSLFKVGVAFVLALLLSWAYLFMPQAFFSIDNRLRDFLFVLRGELPKNEAIVIVDIDEKSLKAHGQWPWQRDLFAELIYKLSDAGAGIIGLDIVFAEEDRTSPHRFAAQFPEISKKLSNYDEILAQTFTQTPVIGGYIFTFEKTEEQNTPMVSGVFIEKGMLGNSSILEPKGIVLNIQMLQNSLYSSGFFNNTPDEGGMIRSIPLVMKYEGIIYSSLALELVRIYSGANTLEVIGDEAGVRRIEFAGYKIPTDNVGRLVVNFRGAGRHFRYISAADILSGNFELQDIKDKFVLVGTSAVGLFDLRSIPFDSAIAGVEVHANAIDNILSGDFLYKPADIVIYDLLILWGIVFIFVFVFSLIKSWLLIPFAMLILYVLFELFFILLFKYGMVFNLVFPLAAYSLTLVLSVAIDYVIASRQKEQAKRMLGKKVSPAVMNYLLEHSDEDLVISREVEATIFFSDIRSFTMISEKIGSPDKLIHMLNAYMTPMVENIIRHQGTIDKFIGDAIMAYWNAPLEVQNHADEALRSAIEQIEMLQEINKTITPTYDVEIKIGIGLHTGVVTAGDMGSFGRSDYTIIGDNVNLASRMEGLTKQYDAQILISHATYLKLQGVYKIRPIDLVEVKGKKEAVEIFEVLCNNKIISEDELMKYSEAVKLFRKGNVRVACGIFEELRIENPSKLYEFYISRCNYFLDNPHAEFTPVLKMTTK